MQYDTLQRSRVRYNTMQCNRVRYTTKQTSTIQYTTKQTSTIRYKANEYDTLQFDAMTEGGAEQQHSLSKATVKHDGEWSPSGRLTVTCWALCPSWDFFGVKFWANSTKVFRRRLWTEVPYVRTYGKGSHTHVKDPVVQVGARWTVETTKQPSLQWQLVKRSESAREQRISLYKSDQQHN